MYEINDRDIFPNFLLDKLLSQPTPNSELNEEELDKALAELQQKKIIMNKRSKDLKLSLYQHFIARTKYQKMKELEKLQREINCLKDDELLIETFIRDDDSIRDIIEIPESESHVPDSSVRKRTVQLI